MKKKLFLVATPIGNYGDITLRAIEILKSVDFIICEEYKIARRLLAHYGINKELISLNEHNEKDVVNEILLKILEGKSAAIISDCGTPLFSDPGHLLVDACILQEIDIVPVPGANSLLPALIGSGFDIEKFYYFGWLSQKKDIRRKQLIDLKKRREVIVVMDTPYRLKTVLADVTKIFGVRTPIVIAFEITNQREKYYRGSAHQLLNMVEQNNMKGEFVMLINNR